MDPNAKRFAIRLGWAIVCTAALPAPLRVGYAEPAPDPAPVVFDRAARLHVEVALRTLNMTTNDAAFDKDVAEPRLAPAGLRRMLEAPFALPELGDRVMAAATGGDAATLWALAAELLEVGPLPDDGIGLSGAADWPVGFDPALTAALDRFLVQAGRAEALAGQAFAGVEAAERDWMAATYLAGVFNAEDHAEVRDAMTAFGFSAALVERVVAEGCAVDPAPAASNMLDGVAAIDMGALLAAGQVLHAGLRQLELDAAHVERWPTQRVDRLTPLGLVSIGSVQSDRYTDPALLILDPAGDDRYSGAAAVVNGLSGRSAGAVLDLAGNDDYGGRGLLAAGSALFGIQVTLDVSGDDRYRAAYAGQGAGLFGVALLEDCAGDDRYRAQGVAQGAGYAGVGLLHDADGRDLYDVGFQGQACAGLRGVGLMIDVAGADHYLAGGRLPDYDRYPERYLTLAQGCAVGMRPFGGGGVAALVDLAGNDVYLADVYGQGVGYWYAVGMLLDRAGLDTYHIFQYGQGAGIHLSLGLLADWGGSDRYQAHALAQGSAHDFAVGMLFDHAGHDRYGGDHHVQGRAINNAFGLLLDGGGDDSYQARDGARAQGIGHDGGLREYGSLALLIDLAGNDGYSSGATNGAAFERPDFGVVLDVAPAVPEGVE